VQYQNRPEILKEDTRFLARIYQVDGKSYLGHFAIAPVDTFCNRVLDNTEKEKLYLPIRCLKPKDQNKGYQLSEGDVVKLGRVKLRVKEIMGNPSGLDLKDFVLSDMLADEEEDSGSDEEKQDAKFPIPCRICLNDDFDENDPLISPCLCDGTMKYIHLKCLQHSLRSKLTTRSSDTTLSFSWKELGCELCKKQYPHKLNVNGKILELVEIPKPPAQYVVFETLCKDRVSSKGLHVVSLCCQNQVKIGRGHDSELRISDISVSRFHALLRYRDGNFYLEDQKSKFGTTVQVKRPIALEEYKGLQFQTGRTLLAISVQKTWMLIPACFRGSQQPDLFSSPMPQGHIPLLPINTGIPLSIADIQELMEKAGLNSKVPQPYKQNNNLLHQHGKIGRNSSCEDEDDQNVDEVLEVEIARLDESLELKKSSFEVGLPEMASGNHSFS